MRSALRALSDSIRVHGGPSCRRGHQVATRQGFRYPSGAFSSTMGLPGASARALEQVLSLAVSVHARSRNARETASSTWSAENKPPRGGLWTRAVSGRAVVRRPPALFVGPPASWQSAALCRRAPHPRADRRRRRGGGRRHVVNRYRPGIDESILKLIFAVPGKPWAAPGDARGDAVHTDAALRIAGPTKGANEQRWRHLTRRAGCCTGPGAPGDPFVARWYLRGVARAPRASSFRVAAGLLQRGRADAPGNPDNPVRKRDGRGDARPRLL